MNHHEHIYSKILTLDELTERLGVMRQGQQKPVVVFTNGCFDLVHRGHVDYLSRARDLGNLMVVGLNSDSSVRRLKGESRPVSNESSRAAVLAAMGFVDYVVRRSPRYTFVIDQSYGAFTKEPLLEAREVQGLPNVILIHSLSRKYSVPGLRLGYITAHPSTILLLRALRHPWSIPALSIEAGKFLIQHRPPVISDVNAYLAETQRLRSELRKIEGIRIFETKTNYMLCELSDATGAALKNYLIHEHGMLIRDCYNFYGLSSGHFRISAQQPEENDALIAAIRQFTEEKKS